MTFHFSTRCCGCWILLAEHYLVPFSAFFARNSMSMSKRLPIRFEYGWVEKRAGAVTESVSILIWYCGCRIFNKNTVHCSCRDACWLPLVRHCVPSGDETGDHIVHISLSLSLSPHACNLMTAIGIFKFIVHACDTHFERAFVRITRTLGVGPKTNRDFSAESCFRFLFVATNTVDFTIATLMYVKWTVKSGIDLAQMSV